MTWDPAIIDKGTVNKPYTFTLRATGLSADLTTAKLTFAFGDGTADSIDVPVSNGQANHVVSHSYSGDNNAYNLGSSISDAYGNILAEAKGIVKIGTVKMENYDLDVCSYWKVAKRGERGVQEDVWNVSIIPKGALFYVKFNMFGNPDRIELEYPVGQEVYNSGWRGSQKFVTEKPNLFPGGLKGPGQGAGYQIFAKTDADSFKATIRAPNTGTEWLYSVICHVPVAGEDKCSFMCGERCDVKLELENDPNDPKKELELELCADCGFTSLADCMARSTCKTLIWPGYGTNYCGPENADKSPDFETAVEKYCRRLKCS